MDNLKCPFCSYNSSHNSEMSIHMKAVHFGIPQEEEEDFGVPEIGSLKRKIKVWHGDSKRVFNGSWYNGCEFHCPREKCGRVYPTKSSLTRHWQLVHSGSVASLAECDVKSVIRYFDCKKCDGRVQRDRDSIRVHLRNCHNCSISEYEDEHGWHDKEDQEEHVVRVSKSSSVSRGPQGNRLKRCLDNETNRNHVNHTGNGKDDKDASKHHNVTIGRWYDGCEYHCPIADLCGKVFPTMCRLTRHWKITHRERVVSLADCKVKKVISHFDCQKCDRQVRRDPDCTRTHLHRYHGMSMKEYGDEFVCGDRDVVEGSQMNNSTSSVIDEGLSRPQGTWITEEVEDDNADSDSIEAMYTHHDDSSDRS